MKDAGSKAAATRAQKGIGREMALKAVATRVLGIVGLSHWCCSSVIATL
jgi:hypothetical protein